VKSLSPSLPLNDLRAPCSTVFYRVPRYSVPNLFPELFPVSCRVNCPTVVRAWHHDAANIRGPGEAQHSYVKRCESPSLRLSPAPIPPRQPISGTVSSHQPNRNLLEAVGTCRAGQPDDSWGWQFPLANPPDQPESLRALRAGCDAEGHIANVIGDSACLAQLSANYRMWVRTGSLESRELLAKIGLNRSLPSCLEA
jgi:hypothetical protein